MKLLPVIKVKPEYYEAVEKYLMEYFVNVFYLPLQNILMEYGKIIQNTDDVVIQAILDGKIQYVDGKFSGTYNSKIVKTFQAMGAKYNKRSFTWHIPMDDLNADIRVAIGTVFSRYEKLHKDVLNLLDNIKPEETMKQLELENIYDKVIKDMNDEFKSAEQIVGVIPEYTPQMVKVISSEYADNMKLYIKNFTEENIKKLRDTVIENTFNGYRASTLVDAFRANYGVSLSKAKFLARQESSLLMSKFREQRYREAGSESYIWQTAGDVRVRERHKHLNGKTFSWSNPPVIDDKGTRGHPGTDFGCRCVARAIIN